MKHYRSFIALVLAALLLAAMLPASSLAAEHTHSWRETSRTEPTCTKKGSVTYICSCGEKRTEELPAKGHSWSGWKTTKEASCTANGEEARTCKACGAKETRKTDKKAHSWGKWTVTVEPTDFTMGTRSHTCKVCGKERAEDFYPDGTLKKGDKGAAVKTLQEKLNAAGHDCGKADGDYGKKTEAAVKALEEAHGFTADGIAWPGVQKWLADGAEGAADPAQTADEPALELSVVQTSPEKETYAIGEEVSFDWKLVNRGAVDLTLDRVSMSWGGGEEVVYDTPLELPAGGETALTNSWTAALDAEWMSDGAWALSFSGRGRAADDGDQAQYAASNAVEFTLQAEPMNWDDLPGGVNSVMSGGKPNPTSPPSSGEEVFDDTPVFRSLEIIKQTKKEDDYYDGAKIPVKLRLTIDSYDDYKLVSVSKSAGDSLDIGDWTKETLEAGKSYEFTYWMVLDPDQTGWKTRNVTVRLKSLTFNTYEEESCEVRPPFTNPTVRIVGGNDNVIDYPAFLYLAVGRKEISGYPTEGADLPITVKTSAADDFSNVKLVIDVNWMGTCFERTTVDLAKKMSGSETRAFIPRWGIRTLQDRWVDYSVTMYVVGSTYDKNNNIQLIKSLPVTIPLVVKDPEKEKGSLKLAYSISPYRDPLWAKDKVQINFRIQNTGKDPVKDVRVEFDDAYKELGKAMGSIVMADDCALLEPGMDAHASLTFEIPDDFVTEKRMQCTFIARGQLEGSGAPVRSQSIWILRGVDTKIPKTGLSLSASVKNSKKYYLPGEKLTCVLNIKNDSDKALERIRVYAVGDNRGADRPADTPWFDLGHGAKGWLCASRHPNLAPGESTQIEVTVAIPQGYDGSAPYRPCWIVDGELADFSPVRSNPASVSLAPAAEGGTVYTDNAVVLDAALRSNQTDKDGWHDADTVRIGFLAGYTGVETPAKLKVEASALQAETSVTTASAVNTVEFKDQLEFQLDASYAINGVCYYTLKAYAYLSDKDEPDVESVERLFSFPIVADEPEPETAPEEEKKVTLEAAAILPEDHEGGSWVSGDTVKVTIDAQYLGEETPAVLEVSVYDTNKNYVAGYSRIAHDQSALHDSYDIVLDGGEENGGKCVFTYVARVYLTEYTKPDYESEKIPLEFDMKPAGIETKINWDAIHTAAAAAEGEGGETGEGGGSETPSGEPADGTDTAKPEGTDTTKPDGTDTAKPDGTDTAKPDGTDTAKPESTDTTKPDGTDTAKPDGTDTAKPDGTDTAKPEGTDTTKPDDADTAKPDGKQETGAGDKCEETIVTIPGDGYDIPATVCVPAGEGPFPAVVMLHGTGSTRDEAGDGYKYAAPVLAEKYGIATIRIDFPGNGDSTADYMLYTFKSAVADAKAAAEYMAGLDNIDGDAIGVMGWSQGGTDALLACAWEPETFKSIVTWAGAPDMMLDGFFSEADYEEAKANGFFVMEFDWRDSLNVSLEWCEDVANTDVLEAFAEGYDGPVLAIAGTEDDTVDPVWSERIVEASGNEKSATYFIEGMDHTFNVFAEADLHSLYEAIDATGAFFAQTLR